MLFIVLLVSLSACSYLEQYLPAENATGNGTVIKIDNPYIFTDNGTLNITENVSVNISTEEILNTSAKENLTENNSENGLVFTTITATEGDIVSLLKLIAEDPDGDAVKYTYSKPFNDKGLWQTNDGDEGKYLITITASDGILSTEEVVQVIILPSNKGPVIDCPSTFTVDEGDLIDLPCTIYDKEGDNVNYTVSGFMNDLTYQTTYSDAGEHLVVISATDGKKTTVKELTVVIKNTNRAPVVEPLDVISVTEGDTVILSINASDVDGDNLTIVYPLLFDETGVWKTTRGDAGVYDLDAIVSDGTADVSVPISIIVNKINVPPVIAPIDDIVVDEGDTITLNINATDADGDNITIDISGFMTEENYTTTYSDAGEHEVVITASDGLHTVKTTVGITINNVNRPPVFVLE